MGRRAAQVLAGTLLGLLTVALAWWLGGVGQGPPADRHILSAPFDAAPLELRAHTGETVSLESLDADLVVVFFGYTHCPDVCPLTMATLSRAVEAMGEAGERVTALLVTVDPARDTVERLAEYMTSFHPGFLGLTGGEEEIRGVAEAWGVFRQVRGEEAPPSEEDAPHSEPDASDRGYLVDHTARSFVVGPDGRVLATFPPGTDAPAVRRTLARLLDDL